MFWTLIFSHTLRIPRSQPTVLAVDYVATLFPSYVDVVIGESKVP